MKFITEANVKNKKVLVRVDFNVDLDKKGKILSDFRLQATLPTINYLLDKSAAKIILMSHLGKPERKNKKFVKIFDQHLTLKPISQHLEKLLNKNVIFLADCIGEKVKKKINEAPLGSIFLLENLRFYPEEENNEEKFAKELASLADIYVNDAFGVCHRRNASVLAIVKFLPSYAGLLLKKEIGSGSP